MNKPLVVHFLWYYKVKERLIIACGKRDVFNELLTTVIRDNVTCTRCRQTLRFKGPTS